MYSVKHNHDNGMSTRGMGKTGKNYCDQHLLGQL